MPCSGVSRLSSRAGENKLKKVENRGLQAVVIMGVFSSTAGQRALPPLAEDRNMNKSITEADARDRAMRYALDGRSVRSLIASLPDDVSDDVMIAARESYYFAQENICDDFS